MSAHSCTNVSPNDLLVKHNHSKKVIPKKENESYQSKNLVTERNRRKRINDGLFTLRSLVPKITKVGEKKNCSSVFFIVLIHFNVFIRNEFL